MNKYFLFSIGIAVSGLIVFAQSRGGNWPTYAGDAQRSGWEGADAAISKDTVKNLQLLWKTRLETQPRGVRPVMPPIIQGRLISYRGFKELAFVATNADIVYAIDADVGTIFWQKHLEYSVREPQVMTSTSTCPGGLTAMPTMPTPARGAAAGRGAPAPAGGQRGSAFVGGQPSVYALSSDGRLHRLNTSTGDDMTQPMSVIPANARSTTLNMADNVIYAVTSHECNDAPKAVWAIDLSVDPPKVRSFAPDREAALSGAVIGTDSVVYVRSIDGSLYALSPRDLQLKGEWKPVYSISGRDMRIATPVAFQFKDRDLIASVCAGQDLCLFDSNNVKDLLSTAQPNSRDGIVESLASWQDNEGTRWILAAKTGALNPEMKAPLTNGPTPNGSIIAFRLEEQGGKLVLSPAWVSRDLESPLPPVIANGVVFALSAGEFTSSDERPKGSTHATLYAFDARTGKELYSSRNQVTVPASLSGLTVANGRVYFGGMDGTVYAFGMYMEH